MNVQLKTISASILFCTLGCCRSSGTELILIIEKKRVALAADSRVIDDSGNRQPDKCKILQSGTDNFFYAVSGPTSDPKIHFDAYKLVEQRSKNLNTADALDKLDVVFVPQLQKELSLIKKEAPDRYTEITQGGTMTSVYVVDGDKREGYAKDYKVSTNGQIVPTPARNCLTTSHHIIELGERCSTMTDRDAIAHLLMNTVLKTDSIAANVQKVMAAAETLRPNEVGPPYSILDIEPTGPQWLDHGRCREIKKPPAKKVPKAAR